MDLDDAAAGRLGGAVKAERLRLGRSQQAAALAGDISVATLGRIERGRAGTYAEATLYGLDRAVDWQDGTAERVALGGSPLPRHAPRPVVEEFTDDQGVVRQRLVVRLEADDAAAIELRARWTRLWDRLLETAPGAGAELLVVAEAALDALQRHRSST